MLLMLQVPIADARRLIPSPAQPFARSFWSTPNVGRDFLPGFGTVLERGLDPAFADERYICDARRALRFPNTRHLDWGFEVKMVFRRLVAATDGVRFELGLEVVVDSLTQEALFRLFGVFLETEVFVPAKNGRRMQLSLIGPGLARLYSDATMPTVARRRTDRAAVSAGRLLVLAAGSELPDCGSDARPFTFFKAIPRKKRTRGAQPCFCVLKPSADAGEMRSLRLTLLRDHADLQISDQVIRLTQKETTAMTRPEPDPRTVFVVHGRNMEARSSIFALLRSLKLQPLEFEQAALFTEKAAPTISEILEVAFSRAAAVVVLMTGDDEARVRDQFSLKEDKEEEQQLTPQPRQNVLFEAGMAFGRHPARTILVQMGKLRPFSDIAGLHAVRLRGDSRDRSALASKLAAAGCPVEFDATDDQRAAEL